MSNYSSNVIEVPVEGYEPNKGINYDARKKIINEHIIKNFKGQKVVVHTINGEDHPGKNIEDVLKDLLEHGTEVVQEKVQEKNKEPGSNESKYDFLGSYHEVGENSDIMGAYAKDKVDLIAIYGAEHVEKAPYSGEAKSPGEAYNIKNKDKKREALKGVLKLVPEKKAEEKQSGAEQKAAIKPKEGANPEQGEPTEEELEQLAAELGL
jgi:hypothetical protein